MNLPHTNWRVFQRVVDIYDRTILMIECSVVPRVGDSVLDEGVTRPVVSVTWKYGFIEDDVDPGTALDQPHTGQALVATVQLGEVTP